MNYTVELQEKSSVKFTLSFDKAEWQEANVQAYEKNKGKYAINGFRKGKVPKHIIENYYGKGCFYEDAINDLYYIHYPEVLEKEKDNYTVVSSADVSIDKVSEDELVFTAVAAIKPDVEIKAYTGIKVEKVEYNVSDEEVQEEIKKLQERNSRLVDITDRPAQDGDTANINFSGSVDGVKFEGGTAENYDLALGSNSFIPGFEAQVVGMSIGEEKDINVTFPEDYHSDDLKGKSAVFAVKVNTLKTKELPEVTDDFIKDATGVESVEKFKAETLEKLTASAVKRSNEETENNIIKEIMKGAKAEIPQAMIETQIDNMIRQMEFKLQYQGVKLNDYLKYMGVEMADFRKNYEETAKENVLSQLIVEKIIKEQKFEATEGEIEEHIAKDASSIDKSVEDYKAKMDPRQLEYIENEIIVGKLFAFLRENNELVAKKPEKSKKNAEKAE